MSFNPQDGIDTVVYENQRGQEQVIDRVLQMFFVFFLPAIFNGIRRLANRER